MIAFAQRLWKSDRAAVAPIVGLSLFGLIAAGGLAFDYARLASMDSELQNAADQAALAAATQLDGEVNACARAAAAAASLLTNTSLLANEPTSTSTNVVIPAASGDDCSGNGSIVFYQSYNQATDTPGPVATAGANARVVLVRVTPRQAHYALTPIVGALSSGNVGAEAIASLGSAVCKTPPVMMCNPAEPEGNDDADFAFNAAGGEGLRLVIGAPDSPGNFGFLRTEESGAKGVAKMVGYDSPPGGCQAVTGVDTEPGNMISVRAALNTRFDISENGATTCPDGGTCSPSVNSRKDLVRAIGDECNLSNSGWREAANPYRATSATTPMDGSSDPDIMGYPRDMCHAISLYGSCAGGIIGDGAWDIDAYFRVNFGWNRSQWMANTKDSEGNPLATVAADVPGVSRYDVYLWEMANPAQVPVPQPIGATGLNGYARPVCRAPGIIPSPPTKPDRRRIAVAVVNCHAQDLKGAAKDVHVVDWLEVFLVEPAIARGNGPSQRSTNGDIYVEVIEKSSSGGGSVTNVIHRRDVPYLIR